MRDNGLVVVVAPTRGAGKRASERLRQIKTHRETVKERERERKKKSFVLASVARTTFGSIFGGHKSEQENVNQWLESRARLRAQLDYTCARIQMQISPQESFGRLCANKSSNSIHR